MNLHEGASLRTNSNEYEGGYTGCLSNNMDNELVVTIRT